MKTMHLGPDSPNGSEGAATEIDRLLAEGKRVSVTITEEHEQLSPREASERLGFSRQHVQRLIAAGELAPEQMPGLRYWKVPLDSLTAFEQRRDRARRRFADLSRELGELGAPLEQPDHHAALSGARRGRDLLRAGDPGFGTSSYQRAVICAQGITVLTVDQGDPTSRLVADGLDRDRCGFHLASIPSGVQGAATS
jgi:excisionase family DNA binding protein